MFGAQNLWITPRELVSTTTGVWVGTWISFAVTTHMLASVFGYCTSHHHWWPITCTVTGFFEATAFMYLLVTTECESTVKRITTVITVATITTRMCRCSASGS